MSEAAIMHQLILDLVPPAELSMNNRHGRDGRSLAEPVAALKAMAAVLGRIGWEGPQLEGDLTAEVWVVWPRGRRFYDLDAIPAMTKPILDGLQGIVYANDRQIRRATFEQARDTTGTWLDGCVALRFGPWTEIEW